MLNVNVNPRIPAAQSNFEFGHMCVPLLILLNSFRELKSDKPLKEITSEIQAIMRQITASVTFLPMLNEPCCFDLLVYADKEATVPLLWEDSDPCLIQNGEQVRMRSFNTKVSYCKFN